MELDSEESIALNINKLNFEDVTSLVHSSVT